MCPAADQKWSIEAMNDCFVMANICPQDHKLNAGAWNTLENKERQWAKRDSAIMIIAGPLYSADDTNRIGNAMQDYAMSIDELEKITGYDFFPALPDELEKTVESSFSFKEWNNSK